MSNVLLLPLTDTISTFDATYVLDGREFVFKFRWNSRVLRWFFSVEDVDGNTLIAGRKMCSEQPLLQREVDERLPPGDLWLIGDGTDPSLRSFGRTHHLLYYEAV